MKKNNPIVSLSFVFTFVHKSTSTLLTSADYITRQINDVADKLEQAESHLGRTNFVPLPEQDRKQDDKLAKASKDW